MPVLPSSVIGGGTYPGELRLRLRYCGNVAPVAPRSSACQR
jgi:hypothetical protein